MSKIHFDAKGRGVYFPGFAECGADNPYTTKAPLKTENPEDVTCVRCTRTKAYREAVDRGVPKSCKKPGIDSEKRQTDQPAPRYDMVFFEGVESLDKM